jgi:hypothetical protein
VKIFGICGKKQSGKDSFGNFVKELLPEMIIKKLSFAYALKYFAITKLGIPKPSCYGSDAEKDYPITTWTYFFTEEILNKYKKNEYSLLSGREVLQIIGTDIFRNKCLSGMKEKFQHLVPKFVEQRLGKDYLDINWGDIWVDILLREIDIYKQTKLANVICIPDVRFRNELLALNEIGATTVRLFRFTDSNNSTNHQSETELEQLEDDLFDYQLYEHENKNLKQLKTFVTNVLTKEELLDFGGLLI